MYEKRVSEGDDYNISQMDLNQYVEKYPYSLSVHNMTITEIIDDKVAGSRWMTLQSWGQKYYMNYDEWVDNQGGTVWDKLIIIEKQPLD